MINTRLLKAELLLSGISQCALAKELRITPKTLSLKLNNHSEFTREEVEKICELTRTDLLKEIFFPGLK